MAGQEIPHAKITIQRPSDAEHSQAGRGRDVGPGSVPRARHQQRDVLQVAAKFGGMDASLMARLKELEAENRRLKKMYAEERIKAEIRQEVIEGKL